MTARSKEPKSPPKKQVEFRLIASPGSKVFIAGTFNNWNPTQHQLTEKNGRYRIALKLAPGRHEYKFIIDGVWCIDPECPNFAPNELGSLNSLTTVQ